MTEMFPATITKKMMQRKQINLNEKEKTIKQFRTSNIQEENSFSYAHIVAKFIERRIDDRRIIRRAFSLDSVDRIIRHEKTKQMTKSKNEGSRSFNRHG